MNRINNLIAHLAKEIAAQIKGAEFVAMVYTNSKGEKSQVTLNMGISYINAVQRSFDKLSEITRSEISILAASLEMDVETVEKARNELLTSWSKKLSGQTTKQGQAQIDAYTNLGRGVRLHNESGIFHVSGLMVNKKVLVEGEPYPKTNSQAKTIAKRKLEKEFNLPVAKFRTYRVTPENLESMTAAKQKFEL